MLGVCRSIIKEITYILIRKNFEEIYSLGTGICAAITIQTPKCRTIAESRASAAMALTMAQLDDHGPARWAYRTQWCNTRVFVGGQTPALEKLTHTLCLDPRSLFLSGGGGGIHPHFVVYGSTHNRNKLYLYRHDTVEIVPSYKCKQSRNPMVQPFRYRWRVNISTVYNDTLVAKGPDKYYVHWRMLEARCLTLLQVGLLYIGRYV